MGAFFTNVQVRVGHISLTDLADALIEGADGFEPVESESDADRVVRLLPADEGGWVTLYDQLTESQDPTALDALGTLACKAVGAPAFSVTVHDSDILLLTLFDDGAVADRYNSFPDYFADAGSGGGDDSDPGQPERWASALGVDAKTLATIWNDDARYAEDILRRTAAVVACDPDRASLGFRYAESLPEGTLSIFLRSTVRPAWETPAAGPPCLELSSHPGTALQLAANDGFRTAVSCRNVGGVGHGLTFMVWGTAIDQGLVDIERFELLVGAPSASNPHRMRTPTRGKSAEGPLLYVEENDLAIAAGAAAPSGFGAGVDMHAFMQAMSAPVVHVNLVGKVVREGSGTLAAGFVPHDNRADGRVGTQVQLKIAPELRRPMRFAADVGVVASTVHLLSPLQGRSRLNALVVFDTERAAAVERARAWLDEREPDAAQVGVYRLDPQKRPKTRDGALNKKLALQDMKNELTVQITANTWGLAFGTGVLASHEDKRAPTLRVSTSDVTQEQAWRKRIDDAVKSGEVLQAALYRSDEGISPPGMTAYENACRLAQMQTTLHSWCSRWVRVPADLALWLGPALAGQLDDDSRSSLEALANIEPMKGSLRVELREAGSMDRFEQALQALLPSSADAQAAVMAMYQAARSE